MSLVLCLAAQGQLVFGHAANASTTLQTGVSMAQSDDQSAGLHVPWKPRPAIGGVKTLFLLVEFMNVRFKSSMTDIESMIESENAWFTQSSYGKMHIDYVIYDQVIALPWPMQVYGMPEPGNQRGDSRTGRTMYYNDIFSLIDNETNIDLGDYKDFVIIHAGGDEAETSQAYDIWSHCFGYGPISDELGENGLYVTARNGAIHNLWGISTFSETEPPSIFIHEYCHSLGLPDLYIYGSDGYSVNTGVSFWSNMDTGAWLDPPSDIDGWNKYILGWVQPVVLDSPHGEYKLHTLDSSNNPKGILMKLSDDEYYFIHARRKVGTDSALPAEGVLVFRINVMRENSHEGEELATLVDANPDTPKEASQYSGEWTRHVQLLDAPYNKKKDPYSFSYGSLSVQVVLSNNVFWDENAEIAFTVTPLGNDVFEVAFAKSPTDLGVNPPSGSATGSSSMFTYAHREFSIESNIVSVLAVKVTNQSVQYESCHTECARTQIIR